MGATILRSWLRWSSAVIIASTAVAGTSVPTGSAQQPSLIEQLTNTYLETVARTGTIKGKFSRANPTDIKGKTFFTPSSEPRITVGVENPEAVSADAIDVTVAGAAKVVKDKVKVEEGSLALASVATFQKLQLTLTPSDNSDLIKSFKVLEDKTKQRLQVGGSLTSMAVIEQKKTTLEAAKLSREEAALKYLADCPNGEKGNRGATEILCQDHLNTFRDADTNIRELSPEGPKYGRFDVYPPATYARISHAVRGTVGIKPNSEANPTCSGVLIGAGLVLTSLHCLTKWDKAPDEVQVVFNYERDLADNEVRPYRDEWEVEKILASELSVDGEFKPPRKVEMDLLLLKLKRKNDRLPGREFRSKRETEPKPTTASQSEPLYPQQCLGARALERNKSVYVIGHPVRRPRAVHDNAWVVFPHEVSKREYAELFASVADQDELVDPQQNKRRETQLKHFKESYRPGKNKQGKDVYRNYPGPRLQPVFGIDSDTSEGDSGAPVFDKQFHQVVGLLIWGSRIPDNAQAIWAVHEAVLSMVEIVKRIDNEKKGSQWQIEESVCVWGRNNAPGKLMVEDAEFVDFCTEICRLKESMKDESKTANESK
jgi:hypothetical protein